MKIAELLAEGAGLLPQRAGLPEPRRETRWLLARALGTNEAWVLAHGEDTVSDASALVFRSWLERRRGGEPAHYIAGTCPFWGRIFTVTPAVLIPRPESELLVECALRLERPARPSVLDVGTGSGCLAVTLALEIPGAEVVAADVSLAAVEVARGNARRLGAHARFATVDLATAWRGPFDLVVANLPYVPDDDLHDLPLEIRAFEPHLALLGGADGADMLRRLVADLPRVLAKDGHALLELGPQQRAVLQPHLTQLGLVEMTVGLDQAGIERVLVLRRG
jgi:release factor glutamine methyltransferase